MNLALPDLPQSACRYERYDPKTLKPTNDSTYVRLIETGWTQDTFSGKSVLDIGSNSGALSLFAHQLGAKSVRSVEVQAPLAEFFAEVVRQHELPITVVQRGFNQLTPETDSADVVLCMEVLHWIVHQGGTLSDAIGRLAAVTGETLYIETPWDILEPSIANRPEYPTENYDIEMILRELARHFESVRLERFMTYFGLMANSKRVLIRASGKREASLPVRHIRDANPTGISMSRGTNPIVLLTTTEGLKALKTVPKNTVFARLADDHVEALGNFLNTADVISPLVTPERLGDAYRQLEADGNTYMLFPFVGNISDYYPERRTPEAVKAPMDLAVAVFLHLSQAPEDLIAPMRELSGPLAPFDYRNLPTKYAERLEAEGLGDFLDQTMQVIGDYDRSLEDALIHNDMQAGNMVRTPDGWDRMVDLDLIRSGPAYSDIFSCALHFGTSAKVLQAALSEAEQLASRPPSKFDLDFAVGSCLLWLKTFLKLQNDASDRVLDRYIAAQKMLREFRDTL